MGCAQCGFESPAGMRFCGGCGAPLSRRCGACSADNPPNFNFCGSCGATLAAGAPAAEAPPPSAAYPPGTSIDLAAQPAERRQLTVMFCDLVGSTSLSAQLDPEELREIVQAYQAVSAEIIGAYEGYIAQYLGDGILAYFGFPVALENEAGRAVRAGRDLIREIKQLSERLERRSGITLAVRIGIHTGVVVVGEIGAGQRREHLALGESPNVAARIQGIAEPNTVVLSGDTYRLVHREFECVDLGLRTIRGIPSPVHLYRPAQARAADLVRPSRAGKADPLVGRDHELATLRERWQGVLAGRGRVVTIGGDAGLGKTTLVRAFAHEIAASQPTILDGLCLPYFRTTAYQPMVELIQRWLGCAPEERSPKQAQLLTRLLDRYGLSDSRALLGGLLGIPPDGDPADDLPAPAQRKERTRAALLELLLRAAEERPLLLYIEDLQWADPSTLELLELLVERVPERRMLALFTHRPEFQPPWGEPAHQSELLLPRLHPDHVEQLILRLTGGKRLPREVTDQIVARTDGVPLFVEELTKMVMESDLLREQADHFELVDGSLPPLAIPLTLHDSLEARLERLATVKELAQLGAVLGREFSYELVRAVTDVGEPALRGALQKIVQAELLVQAGDPPHATYTFKHALIQEVAYQSLLRGVRQSYHLRVARVLEERFPESAAAKPELLAQHYAAAGMTEQAIEHWTRAGRRAVERSANREAISHLRQGLELLDGMTAGPERNARELALLLTLGPALIATHGYAAREVRENYSRARELSLSVEDPDQRFEAVGGLFTSYFVRSEAAEAHELAEELLRVGEATGEPGRVMAARVALGASLLGKGSIEEALQHLDQGLARYQPGRDFGLAHAFGQDFRVAGLGYSAYALLALGFPEQALQRAERAVELARELQHPHSLAFALAFTASVGHLRRDARHVLAAVEELNGLAEREGYRHWLLEVPPLRAWALVESGRVQEGLSALAAPDVPGMDGDGLQALVRHRTVAEAWLRAGRPHEALPLLQRLLDALAVRPVGLWWLAEPLRLYGVALALAGRGAEAEVQLERAVEAARQVGARMFQLRALTDLVRHAPADASAARWRPQLDELCSAFSEGLALPDLQEARALLEHAPPPRGASAGAHPPAPSPRLGRGGGAQRPG